MTLVQSLVPDISETAVPVAISHAMFQCSQRTDTNGKPASAKSTSLITDLMGKC